MTRRLKVWWMELVVMKPKRLHALHDFCSGLLPPEHDEVGGLGDVAFPGFAEGFGVAVAEGVAHAGGSDERRISDDVIRLRPFGAAGIFVIEEGDAWRIRRGLPCR